MADRKLLNLYGDTVVPTTGSHGADIASQRMDALDRECISYALTQDVANSFAIDIGCGLGMQGIRLAFLGLKTLLVDKSDLSDRVERIVRLLDPGQLSLLVKDARKLTPSDFSEAPNIVFSQRFIHYLNFREAQMLVSMFSQTMPVGARLFISASGLHSELGNNYQQKDQPLESRFCRLEKRMAAKHQIREPICLYTEADMKELIVPFGFSAICTGLSAFGNVKGIFEKDTR